MGSKVFEVELNRINDERVRISASFVLEMLPDYFYKIPASSSGRFHPAYG